MSILQMSFSAAVLVMVITIIRAVAMNRLPKKTFLALWAVVVLRLLIPFSVPSPFSVYSLISSTEATEKMTETPGAYILPMIPQTQPEDIATASSQQLPSERIGQIPVSSNAGTPPLWMIVWSAGTALCILYFTIAYIRFYRRFLTSIIVKNGFTASWLEEHKMIRPIRVRQSSRITTPLTYGIFHPVILIPETIDWSDEQQLRYILTHEYVHIRRFDTATKLLLTAALCIHWFNPLVWVMYILANRDLELTCDETVVRNFGETVKASYALTLLNLEERKNVFAPYYSGFSKNATEERIFAIMKYKKSSVITTVLAVLLVAGTTTAFASSALPFVNANPLINEEETERLAHEVAEDFEIQISVDTIRDSLIATINELGIDEEVMLETITEPLAQYFESYSVYGLLVNKNDGRLYYNDQLVGCFSENYVEQIVYLNGVIDVNATRNSSGDLVRIEPYNRQEFLEQTTAHLSESSSTDFDKIWTRAREAVFRGVVSWPLPAGQKEADWNYTAWSAVWNEEWQKAEAGGYLEPLKNYVINSLIIAANNSGSWRNLYQNLYQTSVGLLEN